MNIEQASRDDLEEYAEYLLAETERINYEQNHVLPGVKHELVKVEHELYIRDRIALGARNDD